MLYPFIPAGELLGPECQIRSVSIVADPYLPNWISMLKENYRLIRKNTKPDNVIRLPAKITRNSPCPCGSGKKHKNCCL